MRHSPTRLLCLLGVMVVPMLLAIGSQVIAERPGPPEVPTLGVLQSGSGGVDPALPAPAASSASAGSGGQASGPTTSRTPTSGTADGGFNPQLTAQPAGTTPTNAPADETPAEGDAEEDNR